MSDNQWARDAMKFAASNLPNILQELGEGNEARAFEELAKRYRAQRVGKVEDRRPEIAAGRAEVDAVLEEREAERRKSGKRTKKD